MRYPDPDCDDDQPNEDNRRINFHPHRDVLRFFGHGLVPSAGSLGRAGRIRGEIAHTRLLLCKLRTAFPTDAGRLMLTIMGGIAEFERGLIRKRTDEGIEWAKKRGKKFGRPERLDAGQKRVIADRYGQGATIPELPRNTASAWARSGGRFNPSKPTRRKRGQTA